MEHEQTYFGFLSKVSTADPVGLALQNIFFFLISRPHSCYNHSPLCIFVILTFKYILAHKTFVLFRCFPAFYSLRRHYINLLI